MHVLSAANKDSFIGKKLCCGGHLAADGGQEGVVDVEGVGGEDGRPQAQHRVRRPARDLHQEQQPAHLDTHS